jgi:hypothetical protein
MQCLETTIIAESRFEMDLQHDIEKGKAIEEKRELTKEELLEMAMRMYSLDQIHVIHDEVADTRVRFASYPTAAPTLPRPSQAYCFTAIGERAVTLSTFGTPRVVPMTVSPSTVTVLFK